MVFDRIFLWGFFACLFLLLAIPPLNFWPLVFLTPFFWTKIIRSNQFDASRFRYRKIYFCGLLFWLTTTFWVCFPHPLTSLGWIALSAYLALYWPIFIAVSRRLTQRSTGLNVPAYLAIPAVWVCVEWCRNYVFGGMSLGALEHALFRVPILIQLADCGGQYLIGFLIVLIGCCLQMMLPQKSESIDKERQNEASDSNQRIPIPKPRWFESGVFVFFVVVGVIAGIVYYGTMKLNEPVNQTGREPIRVAITQGNLPVMLNPPPDWWEKTYNQYVDLSQQAYNQSLKENKPLDLIIWPETVFRYPFLDFENGFVPEAYREDHLTPEQIRQGLDWEVKKTENIALELADRWKCSLLLGASAISFRAGEPESAASRFNAAILIDKRNRTIGPRYDKIHLVMFGEYVPFTEYLPDDFPLKTLCQTSGRGSKFVAIPIPGLERKEKTKTLEGVENIVKSKNDVEQNDTLSKHSPPLLASANICFEGIVPHLIRRQVHDLAAEGKEPDILINLSNVGWFYFTSEIDLQYAAQIFRAVENRKPYLTAANGGFSGFIDGNGRIIKQGNRKEATFLIADVQPDGRHSFYTEHGDLFAYVCLACVALLYFTPSQTGRFLT